MHLDSSEKKELLCLWMLQAYLALFFPWVADEAYYWIWSLDLQSGYFDHPPGVAWWFYFGGRFLNVFLLPVAWFLWADLGYLLGVKQSKKLPLMILATPLGLSSGVLSTPDSLLLLCWSVAVWASIRQRSVLACCAVGIGLWSKSIMLLGGVGILWIWLYMDQSRWKRKTLLNLLGVLLIYCPHLLWSWNHFNLPWSFQSQRIANGFSTLEWIGGQILFATPLWCIFGFQLFKDRFILWIQVIQSTVWTQSKNTLPSLLYKIGSSFFSESSSPDSTNLTLEQDSSKVSQALPSLDQIGWWLTFPIFGTWAVISLFTRVEANWTALGWPPFLLWILGTISHVHFQKGLKWGRYFTYPLIFLPLLHKGIPLHWGPPRDGEAIIDCLQQEVQTSFWVAGRYQETALITQAGGSVFYFRGHAPRASQFDLTPQLLLTHHSMKSLSPIDALSKRRETETKSPLPPLVYLGPSKWIKNQCFSVQSIPSSCVFALSLCQPKHEFIKALLSPPPLVKSDINVQKISSKKSFDSEKP